MAEVIFDKDKFHKHMKDKVSQWRADTLMLGDDFAVLVFPYAYRAKEAMDNLLCYSSYYGYRAERDDKRVVVINTAMV